MTDDRAAVILTTLSDAAAADRICRLVVDERLAACVSVVGAVRSTYRWKGEVVRETEQLLVIKTSWSRVDALRLRLLAEHPYEVPEVLVLDASKVPEPYARWLEESTS